MLSNIFENENADAWFGFLTSEGSKGRLIFCFFAYRDFKYLRSRNMEDFYMESGRASETFTAIISRHVRQAEVVWHTPAPKMSHQTD